MSNELTKAQQHELQELSKLSVFNFENAMDEFAGGIEPSLTRLSFRGGKWRIVRDGAETVVVDDDENPVSTIKVVILRGAGGIQRTYYEGDYDPDAAEEPQCRSNDGVRPDPDAPEVQAKLCAQCPQAQRTKISKVSGKLISPCAQNKKLAVLDALDMSAGPMLLRIPPSALRDWRGYVERLSRAQKTAPMVITKLGLDPAADYPKPTFNVESVLNPQSLLQVGAWLRDELTMSAVLGAAPVAAPAADQGAEPTAEQGESKPAPASKKKASKKKASKKKAAKAAEKADESESEELDKDDVADIENAAAQSIEGASDAELDILKSAGAFSGLTDTE